MSEQFSPEELAARKQAMLDQMSPRQRKYILNKVGFDNWDPFAPPKDPIDIRKDPTRRTTHQLVREFLQTRTVGETSTAYNQGVLQMALGIVNDEERIRGMYEFALWYKDLLDRETKKG